jgi:hypothetical protein
MGIIKVDFMGDNTGMKKDIEFDEISWFPVGFLYTYRGMNKFIPYTAVISIDFASDADAKAFCDCYGNAAGTGGRIL